MNCDSCEMLSINGVPCHETGCPNQRATWSEERGQWVHYVECFECGCDVEHGESCDCRDIDWEPDMSEELEEEIG